MIQLQRKKYLPIGIWHFKEKFIVPDNVPEKDISLEDVS